ncbi:hypothetical protein J1TS1_02310 [Shouchella clausii]|jgi:hypothetical protein|nr:hypothetical protein DB29_02812 [Shouchella clausii]SHL78083.1 hypothetical protein SAMN05192535_3446 [Shouchella rhizosphaerae]PAD16894.1 hypothetical protein CHH73_11140 [Shouchella clausii]PAE83670.1 hypothetical protein CHH77_06910 [Shouchella clausii]PAF09728.1 hypothetical protein CHH65_09680 [Shouchella clausii]
MVVLFFCWRKKKILEYCVKFDVEMEGGIKKEERGLSVGQLDCFLVNPRGYMTNFNFITL